MTFPDRLILVVAWLFDSTLGFIALVTAIGVAAAPLPEPLLGYVFMVTALGAVVGLLATGPARSIAVDQDGSEVIVRNLFRTIEVDEADIVRIADGWWASAVHQLGDVAYLVLSRPVRAFVFRRTRVPVHATFRRRGESRRDGAKSDLAQLLNRPSP